MFGLMELDWSRKGKENNFFNSFVYIVKMNGKEMIREENKKLDYAHVTNLASLKFAEDRERKRV